MTVYVVQENSAFDYSRAEEYGDLEFLTLKELRTYGESLTNSEIQHDIVLGLANFKPDDYLILTGNPITMSFAFHIAVSNLGTQGAQHIKLLRWDRIQHQYKIVKFQFSGE